MSRAALHLHRAADDAYGIVTTLLDLGNTYKARRDFRLSLSVLAEALTVARAEGFSDVYAVLSLTRAQVLYGLGEFEQAKGACQEVLALTSEPGHITNRAMTLNLLGRIATGELEPAQARRYLTQGFLLAWRHKDTPMVLENIVAVAELELCVHNFERAHKLLSTAVRHSATPPMARQDAQKMFGLIEAHAPRELGEAHAVPLERWLPAFLGLEARLD